MRQHCPFTTWIVVLAFALSTAAADDKKDQDDAIKADNDAAKIAAAKELTGKLSVAGTSTYFNEKGNPKKYTPEELRKLKGPEKLWGYPGEWSNLQNGQEVKVFLARNKKAAAPALSDDKGNETKKAEVARIY